MAGVIATIPKFQFSANGVPMVGGTLDTYIAGSTTPATTWQDSALTIANTNPISLDARGECVLWLDSTKSYKFVLKNASGVIQWTQDNISGAGSLADKLRTDLAASSGASLVGGAGQVVSSIAGLRALLKTSASKNAIVTGYYTAGDGGGGAYWYDATDTTTADNGVTVIVAADDGRWKLIHNGTVSVKQAGAKGDGVADDAVSINAAISYVNVNGGGAVYFPSGIYRVKSSIQYLPGVDLIGESMATATLQWHPDTNTAGVILDTSNKYLNRARFENLRFAKDASISAITTGILGGSTLANYNSAVACFENLHFDGLTYGVRGNAEPTGVGLFDCYFKNIWCSGCFYGLWLFGSGNLVDQPRMTLCDTAIALDYLNAESYDGMTVTGGTWVGNVYDIGVLSANGIRPTKFIGCWYETSTAGVINILNPGTRVMNLDFIGCMLSTSSATVLFNAVNAVGTVSLDRCTLISGGLIGGVTASQSIVRPSAAGGRLLVKDCQKYDSAGLASFVSDNSYFEAVKSGVNQSVPSAEYTKLTWGAATIDSASGFDNANDTYVIPVSGIYRVVASVAFNPHTVSTNINQVLMYQNGVFRRSAIGASNSTAQTSVILDCIFAFAAGDSVDIRAFHNNVAAVDVLGSNDLTRFSVQFVGYQ